MIHLASRSPRRVHLLAQLGLRFESLAVDVPEMQGPGESAQHYVSRVARDKAAAGLRQLQGEASALVLGADTEVVLDEEVFGKPVDAGQAAVMLRRLADRTHRVISVVWAMDTQRQVSATCISRVRMAALADEDIQRYVATGEAFGKAGGYAIQGRAAAFVRHLEGSYSAVMGLPLHETAQLLREFAHVPFA